MTFHGTNRLSAGQEVISFLKGATALGLLSTLTACGSEAEGDRPESEGLAQQRVGIFEPTIVSGIALPALNPELQKAAGKSGDLACGLPVIPDHSNGRVLEEGKKDAIYETASSAEEVAAFYQAAAKAKNYDVATSGSSGSTRQYIKTMNLTKCDVIAETKTSGGTEVTVRFAYTKK